MGLGDTERALQTLYCAIGEASQREDYHDLLALLGQFPAECQATPAFARARLRLLGNVGEMEQIAAEIKRYWAAGEQWAFLSVFMGWQEAERGNDLSSLETLCSVNEADLLPFERLLYLRTLARTHARQDKAGWQTFFEEALELAQGRARVMILIEYAAALSARNDLPATIRLLSEAKALAHHQPLELRVTELLGNAYARAGALEEAEKHLSRLERLARRKENRHLYGHALQCLAIPRRALGEWARAEALYQDALKAAIRSGNELHQRQALCGLGHTRRLSGRALGALEVLEQAARVVQDDRTSGRSPMYVDLAAALVSLPKLDAVTIGEYLQRAAGLSPEEEQLAQVVRAELARREGHAAEAKARIADLDPTQLWLREEAHAFPDLFALLPPHKRPQPLPRSPRTQVRVTAMGLPNVTVNGRSVLVPSLALVVLVALLHEGPSLGNDFLTEVLDDGKPRSRRQAEQRLSKVVASLRRSLGWTNSIQTGTGSYSLGSDTDWQFDVSEALHAGQPVDSFLSGIGLKWATDTEQRLILRDSDIPSHD